MHQTSRNSLCKLLSRHPFRQSTKPIPPFSNKPTTTITNQHHFNQPISKFHSFLHSIRPNPSTHFRNHDWARKLSSSFDQNREIDEINLKFAEAREEIEMAMESKETVYFDEEAECARDAVKEVLDRFDGLMAKLPESEKGAVQRSMGLKIEQLKAELQQLNE